MTAYNIILVFQSVRLFSQTNPAKEPCLAQMQAKSLPKKQECSDGRMGHEGDVVAAT
jgi:hypothetical protein